MTLYTINDAKITIQYYLLAVMFSVMVIPTLCNAEPNTLISLHDMTMKARDLLDNHYGAGNNPEEAASLLLEVISKDESYVPAYVEMARAVLKGARIESNGYTKNRTEVAKELLKKAIQIDPDYADSYVLMGNVFQDNPTLAASYLDKAEQLGSDNPWLYNNKAYLYFAQKDYSKAEAIYRQITDKELGKDLRQRKSYLNSLTYQMSIAYYRSDLEMIKSLSKKAVAVAAPNDAWTLEHAGRLLCNEGAIDEGIEYLDRSLSIMQFGQARKSMSRCKYAKWATLVHDGKQEEAEPYFVEAYLLDNNLQQIINDFSTYGNMIRALVPILVQRRQELSESTRQPNIQELVDFI